MNNTTMLPPKPRVELTFKKYGVIYADPPWNYSNQGNGGNKNHYPSMTNDELASLPVWRWSDDSTVLVMAATWPFLEVAIGLIKEWGFKYVTGFPFVHTLRPPVVDIQGNMTVTPTFGTGVWVRGCSGMFLIGRSKKSKPPKKNWLGIIGHRMQHSRKPDNIYEYCESMDGPYLEMFAREKREGWDVWGNEVQSDIDLFQGSRDTDSVLSQRILNIVRDMRQLWYAQRTYRWMMGDYIAQMQRLGMSPMDSYRAAADVMGKSVRWAVELFQVAKAFSPSERDMLNVSWNDYRKLYAAGKIDAETVEYGEYEDDIEIDAEVEDD